MNQLSDTSKSRSNRRRFPPGRTLSSSSGDQMDSSYALERTRLVRSKSDGNHSLSLSGVMLDMSGSDRNSSRESLGMSSSALSRTSSRRRQTEKQLFLAHHCTLPENTPNWMSSSAYSEDDGGHRRRNRKAAPPAEPSADPDTPKFLVFRRRKLSLTRASTFD